MKTFKEFFIFLNNSNFESLGGEYGWEAVYLYNNQKTMSLLDIMHYWNLRFTGASRHSFTAANAIYGFLHENKG